MDGEDPGLKIPHPARRAAFSRREKDARSAG